MHDQPRTTVDGDNRVHQNIERGKRKDVSVGHTGKRNIWDCSETDLRIACLIHQ